MTMSLEDFVHSLDLRTLPRILEVQSGFYLEGSAYEMSGKECSLSTGEVLKITGLKIKKIIAEICDHVKDHKFPHLLELPVNFPGLFKIMTDKTPYRTMEEITRTTSIGASRLGHPCVYHQNDLQLKHLTVKRGEKIVLNSIEELHGEAVVKCKVIRDQCSHTFTLPLSQEGDFYECEDANIYTLKEIVDWKIPKGRTRTVELIDVSDKWDLIKSFPKGFRGTLLLKPVYEIQCVMNSQKDIFYILSNLDVDVKDITGSYNGVPFFRFLSTQDIFEMSSVHFPLVAEVIEGPPGSQMPRSLSQPGQTILIRDKYRALRVVASEMTSSFPKRHFLIPTSYQGKFKRRSREFPTAYDLHLAKSTWEPLHVVATKAFQPPHRELASVSVGDQFLVHQLQTIEVHSEGVKKALDVLVCGKLRKGSCEAALLPLSMEGGFIEVVHDTEQYHISSIASSFRFPFNVKVSMPDLSIENDILASTSGLQLEDAITDSYLLISDLATPRECWEIPVSRMNMTVQLLEDFSKVARSVLLRTLVEELSEEQYYMMRRYENSSLHPPPLPPKYPSAEEMKLPQ